MQVQFADGSRIAARLDIADGLMVKIDERSARDPRNRAVSAMPAAAGDVPRTCRAAGHETGERIGHAYVGDALPGMDG